MSSLFNVYGYFIENIDGAFDFFLITLFEKFYALIQVVLILYCHITHTIS